MNLAIATTPRPTAPTTIAPGTVIARAFDPSNGNSPVEIVTGRVLRTGVTDIRKVGWELIRSTVENPLSPEVVGVVGFARTGDTWAAIELLTSAPGRKPIGMWAPFSVENAQRVDGVNLDSLWQISNYGGDYSEQHPEWLAPKR